MKRLFVLVAALAATPPAAHAQQLRFGYPATPAGAIGIVGNALDIWKKHSLDLSAVQTAAAIDTRNAMVAGSVNIGINGLSNFLSATARGAPLETHELLDQPVAPRENDPTRVQQRQKLEVQVALGLGAWRVAYAVLRWSE